jgi:hypothetical protein
MKDSHKAAKNVCKMWPFFGVLNYIRIEPPETQYLSGFPPSRRCKIKVKRAVNVPKFLQLGCVPQ